MINTANVQICRAEVISITCDMCGTVFTAENFLEIQEIHQINFTGGYGSVFGDESKIEADICQRCLKVLIEPFCRINGERNEVKSMEEFQKKYFPSLVGKQCPYCGKELKKEKEAP